MEDKEIKFIDLFAGIGGFRLGFESSGYQCVFSSEIDPHACQMYEENFGDNPKCDITTLNPQDIPDFDVLCAGFPCQAFSISGKQKGFADETRGTLFFDIIRILREKKPTAFVLENVQNLEKHDKGNTLRVMLQCLNELGYTVNYKVLNAKDFNVPQNRERIILVGNRLGKYFDFSKLKTLPALPMKEYLDTEENTQIEFEYLDPSEYTLITNYKQQPKSGLIFIGYRNKKIRTAGVRPGTEHLSRVHKQPNRIYSADGMHPTIASQEQSGRYWIYHQKRVRKLTIDECYRFMGFPTSFKKVGLRSKLYERIGNSVCVTMIEAIAIEIKNQIFNRGDENDMESINPLQFLENVYTEASKIEDITSINLTNQQHEWVKNIVDKEQQLKGVYTVLVSSLTYKCLHPKQDVRCHQVEIENGYSGRSFDKKFVTPFLKSKHFFGAMKESGWLTRSLEQPFKYDLNYQGKINNKLVKTAFLNILHDIEENKVNPKLYLIAIFALSIQEKKKKTVILVNPVESESKLKISEIINLLHNHFYYPYKTRGASILPVIAFYSVYQCMMEEVNRFNGKILDPLNSHTSCDKSSGATGDIVVRDKSTNDLYEVVEIKFDIIPDSIMVDDAYNKFKQYPLQRYYILSTKHADDIETININKKIELIDNKHGCQVIVNGIFETLKYYLRLLSNTDVFLDKYISNLESNPELDYEHKIAWNTVLNNTKKAT